MISIEDLAARRFAAGIEEGKSAEPWLDPSRDFYREAREELADAYNYFKCLLEQLPAGAVLARDRLTEAVRAVVLAYHDLGLAEKIKLETGGR